MEEKNIEEALVNSEIIAKKPEDEDRVKRRRSYLYCAQSLIIALIVTIILVIVHHRTTTEAAPIETTPIESTVAATTTPIEETTTPIETTTATIETTPIHIETTPIHIETPPVTEPIYVTEPVYIPEPTSVIEPTHITEPTSETIVGDAWDKRREEYPAATEAWLFMKNEFGWSDIVCAGIMGNLMRETGGDTLYLKPESNGNSGLGLIQWIGQRRRDIVNKYGSLPTVAQQMTFMKDELYGTNGVRQQVTDQQRERILNADSPEECAAEFARWFERPAETTYGRRENNAARAYEYFVD